HAPDYEFRDLVYGEREAVRILGGRIELFAAERARVVNAPRDLPVVAGQGLHHLLRDRLDDLVRGDALRVAFALPSRQDWYEFRVRAVRSPDPSVVRLRVDLASWVLRLLAPSLEVDYDLETRRLLRYRGVSNLPGPGGAPRTVEIRYAHPEETRAPAY
ncbi:MAG TPA: hypothetical protein VIW03_16280, partial [Anaeromyxobacter sp.]